MEFVNKLDKQYTDLLQDILTNGTPKQSRNGETISVFGRHIRHSMSDGFPLLTTKKLPFKTITTELLWFLKGDTNIKYLVDNGCNIWNGDAYKNYASIECNPPHDHSLSMSEFIEKIKTDDEFAKKWGELGPIYGKQWRNWENEIFERNEKTKQVFHGTQQIDQIQNLINDLKSNPDSRRLMVSAWNVGELDQMVLPPCHYGFQVYTRELRLVERIDIAIEKGLTTKNAHMSEIDFWNWCDRKQIPTRAISLMWNQRSVDTGLGWSFNIASYSLLLIMLAKQVNMIPDEIICNLGDVHLYSNHIEPIKEQLGREPFPLPNVILSDRIVNDISEYTLDDIKLENYQYHPSIKLPLSN